MNMKPEVIFDAEAPRREGATAPGKTGAYSLCLREQRARLSRQPPVGLSGGGRSQRAFPVTPARPHRDKEDRVQRWAGSRASGSTEKQAGLFPIPEGQGQGEGEANSALPQRPSLATGSSILEFLASSRLCGFALTPAVCLSLLAAVLAGCSQHLEAPTQAPPAVTVSRPTQEQVTDAIELTGTVAPSRSVDLVARVAGYLQSVDFQDGTIVETGKVLFLIEPDTYQQQLDLARATLLRANAEYDRQVSLNLSNATSVANVEKWRSERDQAKAQVELANINLGYTRVTAPFTGRIGRRLVDPGNLVGPSVNTKLATLEQLTPIYVYFNLNERDALRLWEAMRQRGLNRPGTRQAPVEIGLQNEPGYPHHGTLDFVDSGISASSGTVQMRAVLTNEDRALFPGLFARVRIPLGEAQPMLVVPNSALGNDQEGDYVLVADANDVVVRRSVVKGALTQTGCAIRNGLTPEDRVIVVGLMRAKPGAKVAPGSR
jgi:RND family efflux transporter MFP subunit